MSERTGSLTDVAGLRVGHWTDPEGATGCTVVLCEEGAVAAVDVRGGAPATRETDLLRPENTVQRAHAILLSGGSAFGLAAADGVVRYLEERGVGFPTAAGPVPIVPAAAIFDLRVGRSDARPGPAGGYAACRQASTDRVEEGSVGAGTGATVGHLFGIAGATKGGVGTASRRLADGAVVGAVAVVNAFGDVLDPASGRVLAGARRPGERAFVRTAEHIELLAQRRRPLGESTTLGIIATDARLDRPALLRVAQMAQDGLARAIEPAHTPLDGDIVFALSTGQKGEGDPAIVGVVAAQVLAAAIVRAVLQAASLVGVPSCHDLEAG